VGDLKTETRWSGPEGDFGRSELCLKLLALAPERSTFISVDRVHLHVKGLVGLGRGRGLTPMQAVEAAFYNGKLQSRLDLFGEATLTTGSPTTTYTSIDRL
jgi:hypothetical protein